LGFVVKTFWEEKTPFQLTRSFFVPFFFLFGCGEAALVPLAKAKALFARMFVRKDESMSARTNGQTLTGHVFGKRSKAQVDGGAHEGKSFLADSVTPCVRQLVNQAMGTQELQQSAHTTAAAAAFLRIACATEAQRTGDVAGVKTSLDMLTA
jgi:hypothetical protein